MDCEYAITDSDLVKLGDKNYIIVGLDDGTVHAYDYDTQKANGGKGFKRVE